MLLNLNGWHGPRRILRGPLEKKKFEHPALQFKHLSEGANSNSILRLESDWHLSLFFS